MITMDKYLEKALEEAKEKLNGKRDIEFRDNLNRASDLLNRALSIASEKGHPELKDLKKVLSILKKIRSKYK